MAHNFREMNIWKKAMVLAENSYSLTRKIPADEKYSLISQINRCAVSIPSNIAEGSGRSTNKDFIHFLNISLSSSYELETQLILVDRLFNLDTNNLLIELQELQKMIAGFKKSLVNNSGN